MPRYLVQYIVEAEDESGADSVWDAASSEAYNNPDVLNLEWIKQEQLDD